ncbi:MAG: peptidase M16 [Chloroflexi bacterium]|nr:peptidase M16 [Chloroflexota bacterium]
MNSHGFELIREEQIEEINTKATLYRHKKTGAELLSLQNDDENKAFGITFRTPPEDSSGVPHIMEHSVLGGSRKYQVKEPFIELSKGSFKTFLNAFTAADWTAYPVATTNSKELYNLVDVYLDAVFHPLITPHHLEQEGWHYELNNLDDPLIYKGVVFNEMKGAYSSPEGVLYKAIKESLFPDNAYRHDSGGNPSAIPNLTYEQFRSFHETYYHPSNARIFFYGDDEPEKRLALLDEYLNEFETVAAAETVNLQPAFEKPQQVSRPYVVDKDGEQKAYVAINWALPEITDPALQMALGVASFAIMSSSASPLRKALVDSRLGSDTVGGGISGAMRQATFSAGLKGVDPENVDKVEPLILQTLEQLAQEGIEQEMIEAALNTIEFSLRENNTGPYPRGLLLMIRSLRNWIYDLDPLEPMKFEAPLTAVKTQLQNNPNYLQDLIRQYLLDNSHRVTLILEPDPELQNRMDAAEKEKLAAVKARLNQKQLQQIIDETQLLKELQAKPDDPAALATIPRLTLDDLDKENKPIPFEIFQLQGAEVLYHDLFTNGIVYLDVGLNLHTLPTELLPFVGLYGRALTQIGTEKEDFVKLQQRIGRKTGGLHASRHITAKRNESDAAAWIFLRGKATMDQANDLLNIARDVLLTVKLDNQERLRQMVHESIARLEAGLIPSGHSVANQRLRATFSESGWVSEQTSGIAYLFFLRQLTQDIESDWAGVLQKLETVRQILTSRQNLILNVTLDGENWAAFRPRLATFINELPNVPVTPQIWNRQQAAASEGLTIPAHVNYVAQGNNLYDLGYEEHGSISVINNYLRTTYLWEKIRVQGGAYGAMVSFSGNTGVYSLLSYRDPNLLDTLANYSSVPAFLRRPVHEDELTKSIIGAISGMDRYQLPDAKGYTSLSRHLAGVDDAYRQRIREEVLATNQDHFAALADVLDGLGGNGRVVILGSAAAIQQANNERGGDWLQITKVK